MSDKTRWEGRDQQLGARIRIVWALFRHPGLGQRKYLCVGVPKGVYSERLLGAKTEIPVDILLLRQLC